MIFESSKYTQRAERKEYLINHSSTKALKDPESFVN
jgi:hypothetical protein